MHSSTFNVKTNSFGSLYEVHLKAFINVNSETNLQFYNLQFGYVFSKLFSTIHYYYSLFLVL